MLQSLKKGTEDVKEQKKKTQVKKKNKKNKNYKIICSPTRSHSQL